MKNQSIVNILLICLALLGGQGCSAMAGDSLPTVTTIYTTAPSNPQAAAALPFEQSLYKDHDARFEIYYPDTWKLVRSTNAADTIHFVKLAIGDEVNHAAVTVIVQGVARNLATVAETARQTIQTQPGVAQLMLLSEQGVEVNGLRGIEQVLTFSLAGKTMTQRLIYLQHSSYTFAISLTVEPEQLASYTPTFETMLRSFKAL